MRAMKILFPHPLLIPFMCIAGMLIFVSVACADTPVNIVAIDGTKTQGAWIGMTDGKVVIEVDAIRRSLEVDDLMVLDFTAPSSTRRAHGGTADPSSAADQTVVHLADGGLLIGKLLPAEGERIALHTNLIGDLTLTFDQLAGVRVASPDAFPTSRELFDDALQTRLPGQDVMVTRGLDDVKALRGRLVQFGPGGGSFVFGDKERTFQPHRLFGIVFAAGVAKGDPQPLFVTLSDGASFSASPLHADAEQLKLRMAGGAEVTIPLAQIDRLDVRSRRLVYVSDLTPESEHAKGRLHRPTPLCRDRSIVGDMIRLGNVTYPKGIAMTSRTEVTYDLGGAFVTFAATVGIDDAVRPYGTVNLLVLGDEKTLLDTGSLTGMDEPRDISVSVQGVKKLTLIADYGDGVDLSDHADWALARLLKKSHSIDARPAAKQKDGD